MSTAEIRGLDLSGMDAEGRQFARRFALRGRVIVAVLFALLLVGVIGGWSATSKLSGAIVTSGTVLVDGEVKAVQQVDGGIVKQISVKDGDQVSFGQVLLRLDDVQIRAERDILVGQLGELNGRKARLVAERDLRQAIEFPPGFAASYRNAALVMRGEQQLFDGGLRARTSQKDQLTLQISQLGNEINGLIAQQKGQADELALAKEERTGLADLAGRKLVEGARLTALDRDIARMSGQAGAIQSNIARAEGKISEINLQVLAIDETARNDAQRELRTVDSQLGEVEERLRATEDRLARTEVRAPAAGTVNELAVHTEGGVIVPAQTLMTIVPSGAALKIEFHVATKDIDQIDVGQAARLRFTAFNRRTTPEIAARVTRVSAAATRDPVTGEHYYTAQVELVGSMSALEGRLVPGMPVEVYVQTQEQVALAYFLKPLTDQVMRAFREE
ncbi:MAG: HlyD family type secretion periplasmic adaptor subunit [Devosia sp.]|uniref:HlyD family type I secretion periplasmic adaptor subunit n=1 Tax=Devosia sp. TaxID=1871048 RepID=UPI0026194682|nr:HlyD family type I secretion periplasmic adaptor subunit [Devosia sp.]MDB5540943.1 HlyD family type secretion periplasmic adaptor subunit [Devosia sp.]